MPDAPIDEPSTAFEVQDSTKANDATNKYDKKMPAIYVDTPSQGEKKEDKGLQHPSQICHLDLT
jgi:hypothetical protein